MREVRTSIELPNIGNVNQERMANQQKKNSDIIKVSKKQLKKIIVTGGVVSLMAIAIPNIVNMGKQAYMRYKGSGYIASEVMNSGLYYNNLNGRLYDSGYVFNYTDANGYIQTVTDNDSFVQELIDEAPEYGLTTEQVVIALDYTFGYDAKTIASSTSKGREVAKMKAFYEQKELEIQQEQQSHGKGK